ncbi:MAG: peptide chain release factor 1 [Candidatus Aminicenantes bacterium]|nr:peptide chain release factor 1 [Candidatus Aminicenantes bacterium]
MRPEWEALAEKYRQLTVRLGDPAFLADPKRFREASKERSDLEPLVRRLEDYRKVESGLRDAREILADESAEPEFKAMAEAEVRRLEAEGEGLERILKELLLPRDPLDEKNVLLEIRAGAGGDEASLFAQDLFRMYTRFAEAKGWKIEVLDSSQSPIGGFKEVVAGIQGKRVYSLLKFESGVHRVQRVPKTEASGRIHTSTVTVAVLPEADEIDVKLDAKDLKIEAFGSSGPGGQNVNRNYTAIRITHKPSGLVVSCQDEKSQHRNKEKALRVLRSRLMDIANREQQERIAQDRRSQVGTGERSEKIRTYNFPQSRITDHRLNESFHNMSGLLDGDIGLLLERLGDQARARALERRNGVA